MIRTVEQRLTEALDDEYKSRPTNRKVIEKFGAVPPFVNIVEGQDRHVGELLALFEKYRIAEPEDRWPARVTVLDTLEEICRKAVDDENTNRVMYYRLLAGTQESDIRRVLENLMSASRDRHLPAFERCASRCGKGRPQGRP